MPTGQGKEKMATPLKVLTALSASFGAAVSGSSGLKVQQGGLTVDDGTTAVQGLTATTLSGSSTLEVGGNATLGGNLTVAGDLTINGTTTTLNTTNLLVEDKKVVIASGSSDANAANTAGLYLGNEDTPVASLQYVSSSFGAAFHSWQSSENLNLASGKALNLNGSTAVSKNTLFSSDIHALANGVYGSVQAGLYTPTVAAGLGIAAGNGAVVSGSEFAAIIAPSLVLSGTTSTKVSNGLTVQGASTLASVTATTVSASVAVSASIFVLADGTQLSSSTQLGGAAGDATKNGVETAYNAVRFVTSSVLDANGYVEVNLTTTANGATYFATEDLNKISVEVLTRPSGDSNYWNNDLVSVKLEVSASGLWAKIDAPAAPNASYRLIAINESDFDMV